MHPALIQAALKVKNRSQADIARVLKVSQSAVSAVVGGNARSQRIEAKIAEVTGLPVSQLWPQWHGSRRRRSRWPEMSHAEAAQVLRNVAG